MAPRNNLATAEQPELLGVKEVALVPAQPSGLAGVVERLAATDIDPDKLERMIGMYERIQQQTARAHFDAAMSAAQAEMRRVATDATNPQTHSRYVTYGALDRVLRPIYTRHGFGLSFNTGEAAQPDYLRVLCEVTHSAGFAKSYHLDMPADGKGAKGGDVMTKTHATGSAVTYGMRYLLKMIFNVAVGEDADDDDGNGATAGDAAPPTPEGFDQWAEDMLAVADEGKARFLAVWNASGEAFRRYALQYRRPMLAEWERRYKAVPRG